MSIKLKGINTKILAGTLALTLMTTPLMGCSGSSLKYEKDSKGNVVCVEDIKYNYLKKYKVLVLGKGDEQFFYIANQETIGDYGSNKTCDEYYDVFGGNLIYSTDIESDFKIITVLELNDYLISYNLIKEEYSEQDLKEILGIVERDFNRETEKQLVK